MHGELVMKIAIISPYSWAHPGGVNNHIEGLSAELARHGHDVTVVAPDGGPPPDGARFVTAGRSVPIPANGSTARLALAPGTGARIRRILKEGAYDVVHVHEPLVPFVSTSAVMGTPARVVGTFHAAGEDDSSLHGLARILFKRVHARIDVLIAVSEPARMLASRYFPGEYEIVPNGVDLIRFTPGGDRPHSFPKAGPVVLFVGRNEPRKGIEVLLSAFPVVAREIPGCSLVIAGSGFEDEKVKRELAPELWERVRVVGFVNNEDLPAYYSAADVFCAPALGGESFGMILLEANASGTSVVASDIPGYAGVLASTGGGTLFANGDSTDLAHALCEMLLDETRRADLVAAGLAGVNQFSWEHLASRLESLYFPPH